MTRPGPAIRPAPTPSTLDRLAHKATDFLVLSNEPTLTIDRADVPVLLNALLNARSATANQQRKF